MENESLSEDIFGLTIEDETQDISKRKICKGIVNYNWNYNIYQSILCETKDLLYYRVIYYISSVEEVSWALVETSFRLFMNRILLFKPSYFYPILKGKS